MVNFSNLAESINPNKFYAPKEVAAMLKVSKRVVYRLIDIGELRAFKVGAQWRILGADLIDFLKEKHSWNL